MESIRGRIEGTTFDFSPRAFQLVAQHQDRLRSVAVDIQQAFRLAANLGQALRIQVIGQADSSGSEQVNRRISVRRAESVMVALRAAGAPSRGFEVLGIGSPESSGGQAGVRRVSFRVLWPAGK